ncbi:helix-turn-helix transcriptional regulator [Pseudoroseicyclus aestuarii]|uniref:helix-turn-helix transcriptional regulator n=1 Tax=Pseudoroseicyclus aestuarii TaxID=1795041 RepID=UPI00319DE576
MTQPCQERFLAPMTEAPAPARRADRLVRLIALLRDGRLHRAEDLAARLGVTPRTIYRDMDRLIAGGVPIAGRRGLGYRATADVTLPPLNLTLAELEALHIGLSVVAEGGEAELRDAARSLSARIDAVLPEDRSQPAAGWGFSTYPLPDAARGFRHMPQLRAAVRARQKLDLRMEEGPRHVLRPLRLGYWGRVWLLTGWSETAQAFAELRADRIAALRVLPQLFTEEPGKTLADMAREGGG